MAHYIISDYIEYTKDFLKDFMKEFFRDKYDIEVSNKLIEIYIDARYSNYGGNEKQRIFYRRIYSALQKEIEIVKYNSNEDMHKQYTNMLEMYQYIFYIDFVRPIKIDLKDFVNQLYEKRIVKFELKRIVGQKDNLYKMIKEYREKKENYLTKFDSPDFELSINKYPLIKDVYKVNLKYNFKITYVYSDRAIQEVYNEGVVYEDKIMIEYIMLTIYNIKNILEGKFNAQYLVDYPTSLFQKEKKGEQILKIIEDPAVQDKIKIKIKYKDFVENKEKIYELMQRGFKFAIIIDETFKIETEEIRKLLMFDYVLISKSNKNFDNFMEYKEPIENLIIVEG